MQKISCAAHPVKLPSIVVAFGIVAIVVSLAACDGDPANRPPLVNSGSYDWRDSFRGPNGYPLPGWGGYFARPQ
jgi:hypothetical protein